MSGVLPSFIKSLKLVQFHLNDVPAIDLVTHSITSVVCDDVKFKRYVLDFDISIDNPGMLLQILKI